MRATDVELTPRDQSDFISVSLGDGADALSVARWSRWHSRTVECIWRSLLARFRVSALQSGH
jgi:hypothetical protein